MTESDFYNTFQSAEDCYRAAFEDGLARLADAVREAAGRERQWLGRVRAGLVALLGFLEDEPAWGRLLIFEPPLGGAATLGCQRRVLNVLVALVDDGSRQTIAVTLPEPGLTAELLAGGVLSVIRAQMLQTPDGALVELAPSLMAFIVRPYLGQAAANAELTGRSAASGRTVSRAAELVAPLPVPFSHRTALVLHAIASAPSSSNCEIAEAAGITDNGQISHLLRRLARRGLIEKVTPRTGSRRENAWMLTPCGQRVIKLLGVATADGRRAAVGVVAEESS